MAQNHRQLRLTQLRELAQCYVWMYVVSHSSGERKRREERDRGREQVEVERRDGGALQRRGLQAILPGHLGLGVSSIAERVKVSHLHLRLGQVYGLVEHVDGFV